MQSAADIKPVFPEHPKTDAPMKPENSGIHGLQVGAKGVQIAGMVLVWPFLSKR
jgi:hypothetical protein